jgi:guanine nucleotide-binding protein subunit alpha-12
MLSCCQTEQDRINKLIEDDIRKEKRKMRQTQKIVLLGVGESGKSTFLKQMHIIHGAGFDSKSKLEFRNQIYENILKAMSGLINGKNQLKIGWSNPKITEVFKNFRLIHKNLMEDRVVEQRGMAIEPAQFSQAVSLIRQLWDEPSIQETYSRRREYPRFYVENIVYYIENLNRISEINYLPSSADILHCRRATTSIVEVELNIRGVPFQFIDVGGQRTQRQKWQHCLSDVTAILFLVSSNEFDEYLREDFTTSRLDESCKVFETLVNYRYLQETSFILFLNKYDLLKEKIKICNIMDYCSDFRGNPTSLDDVKRYLSNRFSMLKQNGQNNFNNNNNESVQLSGSAAKYKYAQSNNNNNEIYTHFTTAVDTENIKVIFEMVKNMIFENNRRVIMLS